MSGTRPRPGGPRPASAATESRDRIAEVFDLAPSFLAILEGPDHVFRRVNTAYLRLVGQRDLIGRKLRDALPEVVAQGFLDILDDVYRSGEAYAASEVPVRLQRDGGEPEERFVSFVYKPLRDGNGEVDGIAAHGFDITDQVRARNELAAREAHFRSLIENSEDKIGVLAEDGRIVFESPAVERLLGWTPEERVGRSVFEFLPPDEHDAVRDQIRKLVDEPGFPVRLEHRLLHRNGSWKPFETVAHARRTPDGVEIVTNSRDITFRKEGEAALAASRERFRTIQDASPAGFMLFRSVRGDDGAVVDFEWEYLNPAAVRFVGREAGEMEGRRLLEEMPGHREEGLFDAYVRVVEDAEPWSGEFRYAHEGLDHVFRAQAVKVDDGFGVSFSDITAEHVAAREVREREARFRALVELIPQLVWATTPEGYHDYFNTRWYDYTGMKRGDDQGWSWKDYLHPDDFDRTQEVWHHSLATGDPYEIEYRLRRGSDGAYRWFIGRALPLYGDDGEIVRWFGTCTDVHDERMALEASRENLERFDAVTRATNDVIWDWDIRGQRLWWNQNLSEVFGLTPEEMTASRDGWSRRIVEEDRGRVLAGFERALEGEGDSWADEYRFLRSDGSTAHVLDRARIMRDAGGAAIRMIGSMSDLTERTRLEEELRQAQKMEAIGKLAGGIAHDFNNLVTVIINYTELLLGDLDEEDPARSDVEEVRKAANRAASLTRQLLAFGRRQVLQPRDIHLNEIVADMEKMLRRVIGEDIALRFQPSPHLGTVNADPGQIEQVVMNLALNARDAMPRGGTLTLRTSTEYLGRAAARQAGARPGDYAVLTVEDSGVGMDRETRDRAFDPFFTTKGPGQGTGLGLSTVHGIVKQSGGFVDVESAFEEGAMFRVGLPQTETERRPDEVLADPTRAAPGSEIVLLVEDEDALRSVVRRGLTRYGYEVLEASNGQEALAVLSEEGGTVDLIVSDLVMPGMGGYELSRRLEERDDAPPILFMTGYAEEDMMPRGQQGRSGEGVIIEKPFTIDQLVTAVAGALQRTAR